jgi:ribosomal protein S18 acetylase RimI-like enzyme
VNSKLLPLAKRHSTAVAGLHQEALPTRFKGRPGRALLTAYYQTVAEGQGACGFVAEDDGGKVIGFICGVWEPILLKDRLIRTRWTALLFWGCAAAVIHPTIALETLGRFRRSADVCTDCPSGYELRPIVLSPAARGKGVASQLVMRLLEDAYSRGYSSIHLLVEPGNEAARALYSKCGFQKATDVQQGGRSYARLERPLGPT